MALSELAKRLYSWVPYSYSIAGEPSHLEMEWRLLADNFREEAEKALIEFAGISERCFIEALRILHNINGPEAAFGLELVVKGLDSDNHEANEVALGCLEQWEDYTLIPLIKNRKYDEKWLEEYRMDVLKYLEEALNDRGVGL